MNISAFQRRTLACIAALLTAGAVHAQGPGKEQMKQIMARYQQELAACNNGQTGQTREACLAEARSSLAEARRGVLGDSMATDAANLTRRCQALPAADRAGCVARMTGEGSTRGSVAAGGIYRELVTIEPVAAPASAPATKDTPAPASAQPPADKPTAPAPKAP